MKKFTLSAFLFLFALTTAQASYITKGGAGVDCTSGSSGQVYTTNGSACSFTSVAGTGTVTSVDLSLTSMPWFTIAGNPVTGSGTLALSLTSGQAANRFLGSPNGSTGTLSLRALVGADLPNPSSSSLGGVQSAAAVSNQWINSISTSGVPALSQPAFTNISGSVAASQLPNPSASTLGGIQSAAAVSNQWINSISTSGVPALSQPAFSNLSGTASLTSQVTGTLPIANGGTAVTSVTTAPTASSWAGWDGNSNLSANIFIGGYATTATSAGISTLTVASKFTQFFTGSTTHTVTLPVTSTMVLGQQFIIVNRSSGVVTVNSSGGNAVQAMAANTQLLVTVILTSGTTAASWDAVYASNALAAGGGGANTALSNLASVAINADLAFSGDVTWKVGTKTSRASQMFAAKFSTNDDTTTTPFVTLASDADGSGNPGLIFATTSTSSTWTRVFTDSSKVVKWSFGGTTVLTFSSAGINSTTGGQMGNFCTGGNCLNFYGALAYNDVQSNTGASNFTVTDMRNHVFVTNTGTLSSLTITMPPTPASNMPLDLTFQSAVTTLTLTPNSGQTFLITPPTTVTQGQVLHYLFRGADNKWWPN